MFRNIHIKYSVVVILLISSLNFSCNKQLDVLSKEAAGEDVSWQNITDTKSALLGMYGLMRSALVDNNAHWMYGELREGDFRSYSRQDIKAVINSELNKSYTLLSDLSSWRRFYAVINAASIFIERAPKVVELDSRYTEINLKQDIAQARTIRAFAYFYMVRIWGDVPLITKSYDNGSFPEVARTDYKDVLKFAEDEIISSVEDMPFQYGVAPQVYYGSNTSNWQKVLFNKISAYAILSHIAAYQGKYIDVASYTEFIFDNYTKSNLGYNQNIISSSTSSRGLTGYFGIFSNNYAFGQIVNFSASYAYGEATASGHIEQLTLAQPFINKVNPDIYVDKDVINEIFVDPNDQRFGVDPLSGLYREYYFKNYSNEIPVFAKINIIRDGFAEGNYAVYGSNLVFTRLEELILLRAEALAFLGQNIKAIECLNVVKSQRKAFAYQASELTTNPLINEIFEERRKELMGEGWRFHDLVRLNRIVNVDQNIVQLINNKGMFWPIANTVLSNNKKLVQNEYWSNK